MKSPIWKIEEILDLPEFGGKVGWFYGFVWYEDKLQWGEIYPGLGFSRGFYIWFEEEEHKIYSAIIAIKRIIGDVWWAAKKGRLNVEVNSMAKKKKQKEVEMEPGDDTAEAQPSIEREGAPIGNSGGASPSGGNVSGGDAAAPAGNP